MAHPPNHQRSSPRVAGKKGGRPGSSRHASQLAEARHLLSLRQLEPCLRMVREILHEDPGNQAAKGLLELVTLQLLPKPDTSQTGSGSPPPTKSGAHTQALTGASSKVENTEIASQFQFLLESPLPLEEEPAENEPLHSEVPEDSEAISDPNTMRERTISALVDLFQQKEKTLKDWQDPRFGEASPLPAAQPSPASQHPSGILERPMGGNPPKADTYRSKSAGGFLGWIFHRKKHAK